MKRILIHTWNWFIPATFGVILLFVIYCFFVAVLPIDVVTFNKQPLTVLNPNKEVKRGDYLLMESDFCKHFPIDAEIVTYIEDGVKWRLPDSHTNSETGCKKITMKVLIPSTIPPDTEVRVHRILSYRVSPFSTKEEIVFSEYFTVI